MPKDKASIKISEPCASCAVRCCNRFAVPITVFDAARICKKLKCRPEEFAALADAKNIEPSIHSGIFIFHDGFLEERLLTLLRLPNNFCIFSRHLQGCAIWGFHPTVCQAYPFILGEDISLAYTKNFACMRKWQDNEYNKKKMLKLAMQNHVEIMMHNKIVREWNAKKANKGGEKEFWKFALAKAKKGLDWK